MIKVPSAMEKQAIQAFKINFSIWENEIKKKKKLNPSLICTDSGKPETHQNQTDNNFNIMNDVWWWYTVE